MPRDLRFTVAERCGPNGVIEPLNDDGLEKTLQQLEEAEPESVAVCLLFGYLHPEHERAVAQEVRTRFSHVHVSVSHEVLAEFREFERFSTTVADAYLGPRLATYLENLARRCDRERVPRPVVMQSSGGVMDLERATASAAACVLSGPAAGVVSASHVAGLSGFADVLTFDMGGTSTDVTPIVWPSRANHGGCDRRCADQAPDGRRAHGRSGWGIDCLDRRRGSTARGAPICRSDPRVPLAMAEAEPNRRSAMPISCWVI